MSRTVELMICVTTDDTHPNAADRIEHTTRRCLGLWFDPHHITVEQTKRPHADDLTRTPRHRSRGW